MIAGSRNADRDLDEEMQLHMDLLSRRERASGASTREADEQARKRFGSPLRMKERSRDARGGRWLADVTQDGRYAIRTLLRERAFAIAAIVTLALGIGATSAIFSVVNGVVLRPLPYREPDRLVRLYGTPAIRGEAVENLERYREQTTSFDGLVGFGVSAKFLRGPNGPERVMAVTADRDLFSLLGVAPLIGRTFEPSDGANVAVAAQSFWREHLGADRALIGSQVSLDSEPFTLIGVMPDAFQFPYASGSLSGAASQTQTDIWIPSRPPLTTPSRTERVVGRLKADVSIDAASAELDVVAARLQAEHPDRYGPRGVRLAPLADTIVTASVKRPLFVLLGAVAIVLALACANVMNLLLVRTTVRAREIAVRAALGASTPRLARQLLTESLILAFAGGAAGMVVSAWATGQIARMAAAELPRARDVSIDWRVMLFSFVVSAVTAGIFGVAPAVMALRARASGAVLASGARATMGRGARRLRDVLVVAEVALAFTLAVGAALLVRELVRLRATDPGFITRNVVTFHVGERPGWWGVNGARDIAAADAREYYELARRVAVLPGVEAAGFTQLLPLQNWGWTANTTDFRAAGSPLPQPAPFLVELRYVTPGYFQALGIQVRRGRAFTDADDQDHAHVIMINDALARLYFGDGDPVGASTTRGTIVGVVSNVRQVNLDRSASPEIYYPVAQNYSQLLDLGLTLVVRTTSSPGAAIPAVRNVIRDVAPNQAVFNVKTMDEVVSDSLAVFTLYLWLMVAFAALALVLALVGTYGVISYSAASRSREFAVRSALGATPSRLTSLVFRDGVRLTAIGLAGGASATVAAAPLLRSLPVTVRGPNLLTVAGVALVIGATAMAACLAPALRASGANPMRALRDE